MYLRSVRRRCLETGSRILNNKQLIGPYQQGSVMKQALNGKVYGQPNELVIATANWLLYETWIANSGDDHRIAQ